MRLNLQNIIVPFDQLGLHKSLMQPLKDRQHITPYPIQQQAIPAILDGKDILGIAPTGSGKTASYVLPILSKLISSDQAKNRYIEALILVPTRELATQVQEVLVDFNKGIKAPVRTKAVFGGVSINPQMKGMSGVRALVATPGRLLDLIDSKALSLEALRMVVLDEADKMLNMGFREEMNRILGMLPAKRQNLLFSATLSPDVEHITTLMLQSPVTIKVAAAEDKTELIEQRAYAVSDESKGPLLRKLIDDEDMQQVLIFTSSKKKADRVAEKLNKNGIEARATHGDKSTQARRLALEDFKNKILRVLVATDILARGIDIAFLPYVINYELPRSPKDFVHRVGRTGRAENPGQALSLVSPDEEHHFRVIQKKMKSRVELLDGDAHLLDKSQQA